VPQGTAALALVPLIAYAAAELREVGCLAQYRDSASQIILAQCLDESGDLVVGGAALGAMGSGAKETTLGFDDRFF
jgi:hypothetical protein